MLRFERRQITANVVQGVAPYVNAFEARYGALPTGYWEDEYVLGFVPALAGLFTGALTRNQISEADRLAVVEESLHELSRGFGPQIMQQVKRLTLTRPADFVAAAEAAAKVLAFSLGQVPADDPDLVQAKLNAQQQRGGVAAADKTVDFADTARALLELLFYDVVNKRLMADFNLPETDGAAAIDVDAEISPSGSVVVKF
jgi:hypothetical protein